MAVELLILDRFMVLQLLNNAYNRMAYIISPSENYMDCHMDWVRLNCINIKHEFKIYLFSFYNWDYFYIWKEKE
jgi:hypothetical protein